jgi:hypothetical protein
MLQAASTKPSSQRRYLEPGAGMGVGTNATAASAAALGQAGGGAAAMSASAEPAPAAQGVGTDAPPASAATVAQVGGSAQRTSGSDDVDSLPSFNRHVALVPFQKALSHDALLAAADEQPAGDWLEQQGISVSQPAELVLTAVLTSVDKVVDDWVGTLESTRALIYSSAAEAFFKQQWEARRPGQAPPRPWATRRSRLVLTISHGC